MSTSTVVTTAEQLLDAPDVGRSELIRGELVMMSPSGFRHMRIAARIARLLDEFVDERALGAVGGAEGGFLLSRDPDTVRAPDASFVAAARIPEDEPTGFFPGPPDLAVEVLSPNDRAADVLAKVQSWLQAGTRMVWVVDPDTRTLTRYASLDDIRVLQDNEMIDGGDVLPGFAVKVERLLG